jgi:hypothetical protein
LALPSVNALFKTVEELLHEFRYKEARLKLKALQVAAQHGEFLNLIRPVDTRWSSWLFAIERLLTLRVYVDLVSRQSARFWSELEDVQRFLKPFQEATDVMQRDGSTLHDLYRQFRRLLLHARQAEPPSIFAAAKDDIVNVILDQWDKFVNQDAVAICTLLSFDSAGAEEFKDKLSAAKRWFRDYAVDYAMYWKVASSSDRRQLERAALQEWSDFEGCAPGSCFDRRHEDVRKLREHHASLKQPFNARAVWNLYLTDAPIISHAAVSILCAGASEAAVERTFSAQGLVHTDRRNRLADVAVEAEMFIKFNARAVAAAESRGKAEKHQRRDAAPHCVEMSEDYEEELPLSRIAGAFQRPLSQEQRVEAAASAAAEEQKGEGMEDVSAQLPAISAVAAPVTSPAVDHVMAFIKYYVAKYGVTAQWRWNYDRLNQLHVEGQGGEGWTGPLMRDTDPELKAKIMCYVRGESEESAPAL